MPGTVWYSALDLKKKKPTDFCYNAGNIMVKAETANVGFLQHAARKLTTTVLSHTVFRSERTDNGHGIDKAKEVLRQGNGLIIVINHFSLKDPPQAINEVFLHREMGSKKVVAPVAYHMDKDWYHKLGKIIGVTLTPVVTENSVKEGKNNGHKLNEGKIEYLNESTQLLKKGGVVVLAPQGTRMSYLGQPDKPIIGTIMAGAKKNGLEKFAFLFMGFRVEGVDNYSDKKVRGFNLLKKYGINIGACLTNHELMEKAGGDFRAVDRIAYEELRKIVPPNYIGKVTSAV